MTAVVCDPCLLSLFALCDARLLWVQVHVFATRGTDNTPIATLTTAGSVLDVSVEAADAVTAGASGYLVGVVGLQQHFNQGVDNGFALVAHLTL